MSSADGPQVVQPGLEHVPVSQLYPQGVPSYGLEHTPASHVWPENISPVPQYEKQQAGVLMAETGRGSFPDHHKILGLQRVTFFLALIIALLVIAGAVGGGIGGSIAAKKKSSVDNAQRFVSALILLRFLV